MNIFIWTSLQGFNCMDVSIYKTEALSVCLIWHLFYRMFLSISGNPVRPIFRSLVTILLLSTADYCHKALFDSSFQSPSPICLFTAISSLAWVHSSKSVPMTKSSLTISNVTSKYQHLHNKRNLLQWRSGKWKETGGNGERYWLKGTQCGQWHAVWVPLSSRKDCFEKHAAREGNKTSYSHHVVNASQSSHKLEGFGL